MAEKKIKLACILAAGSGTRLLPLTKKIPKCLIEINNQTLLANALTILKYHGIENVILVVGYKSKLIEAHVKKLPNIPRVIFVNNPIFNVTNNIYSLWLAKKYLNSNFLLLESDLLFNQEQLSTCLNPSTVAVSNRLGWMNGTTVTIDKNGFIDKFWMKDDILSSNLNYYKTVNIYSFSTTEWNAILELLSRYINKNKVTLYYETVFQELVASKILKLKPAWFEKDKWYEIDTVVDLHNAKKIFSPLKILM